MEDQKIFSDVLPYEVARAQYIEKKQKAKENSIDLDFQEACRLYQEQMVKNINAAIDVLIKMDPKEGRAPFANVDTKFLQVSHGRNYKGAKTVYPVGGKRYPAHVVHYGMHNPGPRHWVNRNFDTWKEKGVPHPFKEIQKEYAKKKYYVQDLSDPSKGRSIIIRVSTEPYKSTKKLWHGLNVIPE